LNLRPNFVLTSTYWNYQELSTCRALIEKRL